MGKRGFGELELAILNILREEGEATVRDVFDKLGKKGSYTTIMTVMSRMAAKGELKREKSGKQYIYWTAKPKPKGVFTHIREKVFGGDNVSMVSYLLEEEISPEELKEIEKLIKQKKSYG